VKWPDIERPYLAFGVYLGIGVVLAEYGIRDGSLLLLDVLIGVAIYKLFSRY
jgi:hypothetical protein